MDTARGLGFRAGIARTSQLGLALIIMNAVSPAVLMASDQGSSATTATAPIAPAAASNALEEIVITSTKRSEDLQRVPIAVTVVTGEELSAMGIVGLGGLSDFIPSARLEPFESATHLYVRGIGSEQDRNFVNQLVAVVIDGVYMPRNTTNIPEFDVNQAEVLPGPQGTLYGAGAAGGVIHIANNRPTRNTEMSAMAEVGNFGAVHATLVDNVPLSDSVAVRAAVDYQAHNNYETGLGSGDSLNYAAARLSLLAKPSEDFSAYFWATYNRNTGNPASLVVTTGPGMALACRLTLQLAVCVLICSVPV